MLSRVNITQLTQTATRLNGGKTCVFEPGKYRGDGAIMGCANYHGWLVFEDGERWLARIPRDTFTDLPPDLVEYIIASEYATLKFLEDLRIPAPKAFGYALASDPANSVGVTYLLIEALSGKPYYPHLATPEQTAHVLEQVADILIELSKSPLPRAGSLVMRKISNQGRPSDHSSPVPEVGPLASNRFLHLDHRLGPFSTGEEYFASVSKTYLDILADRQLEQSDPVAARKFYEAVYANAPALDRLSSNHEGQFFLKHVDDKGDHLLIDDDYNIVGIIDWQFSRVVPAAEAFGPSLLTADMGVLYTGNQPCALTPEDEVLARTLRKKGRPDLAEYMEGRGRRRISGDGANELMRRIQFGIPAGSSAEESRHVLATLLSELEDIKVEENPKY